MSCIRPCVKHPICRIPVAGKSNTPAWILAVLPNENGSTSWDFSANRLQDGGTWKAVMLNKNDGAVQLRVVGLSAVDQRGAVDGKTVIRWRNQLLADNLESHLEALQQICLHSPVIGLAEPVIRLAGSRDDAVRVWAAQALESAVHPSPDEIPGFMSCLQDGTDGEFSYWAATLLGRLESHAAAATQALCDCLQHSLSLPARERAAWALMKIGPDAASAIPVLREVSKTAPARLKHLVEAALEMVEGSERKPAKFAA